MSTRFFATRLDGAGGEVLLESDLPLINVSVNEVLSGPSTIEASLSPEIPRLMTASGESIFVPWSTAIYMEQDGLIRAGGILLSTEADGPVMKLNIGGFTSYLQEMPFTGDYSGYNLDPLDIVRMIWAHVQGKPYGNLGLIVSSNKSPVRVGVRGHPALRGRPEIKDENGVVALTALPAQPEVKKQPFILAWHQTSDLSKVLVDLATATPFDYLERHVWVNRGTCEIQHYLDLTYPRIDRKRDDLRFSLGENIFQPPSLEETEDSYASEVHILGAGEGSKMTHGIAIDNRQKRLRRVAIRTAKGVGKVTTANDIARNELRFKTGRLAMNELVVVNTALAPTWDIAVGDRIMVQAGGDWYSVVDQELRIVEIARAPLSSDSIRIRVAKEDAD